MAKIIFTDHTRTKHSDAHTYAVYAKTELIGDRLNFAAAIGLARVAAPNHGPCLVVRSDGVTMRTFTANGEKMQCN